MLFKPEMIDAILRGDKSQTRRIAGDNDVASYAPDGAIEAVYALGMNGKERIKWRVGQTYAIQPGRGKGGIYARLAMSGKHEWQTTRPDGNGGAQWKPMRILLKAIRREPVQDISEADALAEGVLNVPDYRSLWIRINGAGSWSANPDVWVLTFELTEGGDASQ